MKNVYRINPIVPAVVILLSVLVLPAAGQEPSQKRGEPLAPPGFSLIPWDDDYNLSKERVPLSELVRGMFPRIAEYLDDDVFRGQKLDRSFGFREGSEHEGALLRAILAAREVEPDETEVARTNEQALAILASEGRDAYMRTIREQSRSEAHALGVVWGQFIVDLGGPDSLPMVKIREYLEGRRQDISIASTDSFSDPNHPIWANERAFRSGVRSVPGAWLEGWE